MLTPEQAQLAAIREAVLFNYVGLWTVDPLYMIRTSRDLGVQRPVPPFSEVRPDMTPRGFISFVYDGQYKFARYYAPDNFATPTTFEALTANYDLELFDLESDPDEMHSLTVEAARRGLHAPERVAQPHDRPRGRRQRRQLPARDPAPTLTGRRSLLAKAGGGGGITTAAASRPITQAASALSPQFASVISPLRQRAA